MSSSVVFGFSAASHFTIEIFEFVFIVLVSISLAHLLVLLCKECLHLDVLNAIVFCFFGVMLLHNPTCSDRELCITSPRGIGCPRSL